MSKRMDGMPEAAAHPRTFDVARDRDHSGVSGEGDVACGVMFPDGAVVVQWQTAVRSIVVYSSVADMLYIHGHGESTGIRFHDQPERLYLAGGGWVPHKVER